MSENQTAAFEAHAHDLLKTESICGRASSKKVKSFYESMARSGWVGSPIQIVMIASEKYIINGHHRAFAARLAGIMVLCRVIGETELLYYGYGSISEVIAAHVETGPNRIRVR